ncbi:hypothetical protein [Streptomyces brasiliensis]|uniref:Uncharacterized protein n=1 Tax=Streptomyces brasiliensis TaxID=1954 RepID=A0A917KXS5_9ACTN|nr:hypothetical protein [Streptomyces brasiliensis]GGJ34970.1 hypothetical protein GCM10010121_052740 [Streptomyces brasiliensis]
MTETARATELKRWLKATIRHGSGTALFAVCRLRCGLSSKAVEIRMMSGRLGDERSHGAVEQVDFGDVVESAAVRD